MNLQHGVARKGLIYTNELINKKQKMTIQVLNELFTRDLGRLKKEIKLYKSDTTLWKIDHAINNSGGNLCLHLIGNLKNYIGNGLSEIGYIRDRPFEFAGKSVDREKLYQEIDETINIVNNGLSEIKEAQLKDNFPIKIWENETNMAFTLIHLHSHLNYHLGQISYHRRTLDY